MYTVPKIVSTPTGANTSAFLTELSPEIRNLIYRILLKRDCPVLLHNTAVFHTLLPAPTANRDVMESYYARIEREIISSKDFRHGFEGTTSLLLACRQIYHEAARILYRENSFVISRVGNQHDHEEVYARSQAQPNYFQTTYACSWLAGLGSQVHILQKVVIDVDTMCPATCHQTISLYGLDILPLMRILWESPELFKVIRFGHSGRFLSVHNSSSSDYDSSNEDHIDDGDAVNLAKVLNNLLVTLVAEDALNIKRYRKFTHLLSCVELSLPSYHQAVSVHFKPSELKVAKWEQTWMFDISDEGKTVTRNPPQPLNLLDLPKSVKFRIFEFASYNPDGIVFNLSAQKLHGIDIGIFQINRKLRPYFHRVVAQVNTVTIELTSTNIVTDFDEFRALASKTQLALFPNSKGEFLSRTRFPYYRTWFAHYDSLKLPTLPGGWKPKKIRPVIILLKIKSSTTSTLSAVRINIKYLLSVLCDSEMHDEATLRITLECLWGTRNRTETAEVPIKKLKAKLFLLLSDLIVKSGTQTNILRPAADIYIDGHGVPLEATVVTVSIQRQHFSVTFDHGGLNTVELRARGYQRAAGLASYRDRLVEVGNTKSVTLIDQWASLRSSAVPDWKHQTGH